MFLKSPFSILNKERSIMDYLKGIYSKRVQEEFESYKKNVDKEKKNTNYLRNKLMLDAFSV